MKKLILSLAAIVIIAGLAFTQSEPLTANETWKRMLLIAVTNQRSYGMLGNPGVFGGGETFNLTVCPSDSSDCYHAVDVTFDESSRTIYVIIER